MTQPAYDELYVDEFRLNFASMLDYVVNDCGIDVDEFMRGFVFSGNASRVEAGNPRYLVGLSGVELGRMVLATMDRAMTELPDPVLRLDRTKEYWCGWEIAYYQWLRGERFKDLLSDGLTPSVVIKKYILHEAGDEKFVSMADALLSRNRRQRPTRLKTLRQARGFTQAQLAAASGVSLRMIQLYEQRRNNIMKAEFATVRSLARALCCRIDDLIEPPIYE